MELAGAVQYARSEAVKRNTSIIVKTTRAICLATGCTGWEVAVVSGNHTKAVSSPRRRCHHHNHL